MESLIKTTPIMEKNTTISKSYQVRYNGNWFEITPKKYEPERQTFQIAWKLIRGESSKNVYREWFLKEQENAQILYPSF